MTYKICDECETVAQCMKAGCFHKVMDAFNSFKQEEAKLNADYYIKRILKSETPAELLKNQFDLVLFLNRRFGYKTEQFLETYKDILRTFEKSEPKGDVE